MKRRKIKNFIRTSDAYFLVQLFSHWTYQNRLVSTAFRYSRLGDLNE